MRLVLPAPAFFVNRWPRCPLVEFAEQLVTLGRLTVDVQNERCHQRIKDRARCSPVTRPHITVFVTLKEIGDCAVDKPIERELRTPDVTGDRVMADNFVTLHSMRFLDDQIIVEFVIPSPEGNDLTIEVPIDQATSLDSAVVDARREIADCADAIARAARSDDPKP